MVKFDGIRMQDLVEVKDPDEEGGMTLVFKDDKFLKIKVVISNLLVLITKLYHHLTFEEKSY